MDKTDIIAGVVAVFFIWIMIALIVSIINWGDPATELCKELGYEYVKYIDSRSFCQKIDQDALTIIRSKNEVECRSEFFSSFAAMLSFQKSPSLVCYVVKGE